MKTDSPLQRGKACLCCRKRKMKCDGIRPICSQCLKANREAECQYYDKKQISRTQILQQKVAKLEARLRELESEHSDSSTTGSSPSPSSSGETGAHDPQSNVLLESPSVQPGWEANLFDENNISGTSSAFLDAFAAGSTPDGVGNFLDFFDTNSSTTPYSSGSPVAGPSSSPANWREASGTLCYNKVTLLTIFFAHRHQCMFDTDIDRFQASLTLAPQDQPHPSLVDAVFLMGCYFSRSPSYTTLESHFLKRALTGISEALQANDRVINVLQASCLLALYFFSRGRVLEGYYHSSIAARLAVSLGLHQMRSDSWFDNQLPSFTSAEYPASFAKSSVQLAPAKDAGEYAERVAAFWQVFMVDRAWSVATGLPAALPDDDHSQAQAEILPDFSVTLGEGALPRFDPVTPYPMLRSKAIALFERSFRMASVSVKNHMYWARHRALEMSLAQFAVDLPPLGLMAGACAIPLIEFDLLTVHTLIHVSTIYLHRELSDTTPTSYEKCIVAASSVTSYIRQLNETDYLYLDPISSTCWSAVADVFLRALSSAANAETMQSTLHFLTQELDLLVNSMRRLSTIFPIAGIHAAKVEQDRASNTTFGFS